MGVEFFPPFFPFFLRRVASERFVFSRPKDDPKNILERLVKGTNGCTEANEYMVNVYL